MKMVLTRIGEGSRMVINGDLSQVDLPKGQLSGLKETEKIGIQSNQMSSIETSSPQYFSLEKIDYSKINSAKNIISETTYSIIYIAGVVLLASLIVISMLPQFNARTKSTAMLFFLAALSLIVLKGISYNNLIESSNNSFFGIQGYGVILVCLLLFVITCLLYTSPSPRDRG